MSFTINSMVFKVFLPILVGLAIFGTLDSIKVNSLDPNVNSLDQALGSLDRSVTFGDIYESEEKEIVDEEKSKQEVRETVIYNIIAAQNCNLLKPIYEAEWKDMESGNPDEDVVYLYDYPSNPDISNDEQSSFEVSREEELSITCVGAESPSELVKAPGETLASGDTENSQTNDMEGRFGRIDFQTENTIRFENAKIGSTAIYKDSFSNIGSNFPDFWRNDRVAAFMPDNLRREDCGHLDKPLKKQARIYRNIEDISNAFESGSGNNEDINVYEGPSDERLIYAFRVRTNMPIVKKGYAKTQIRHTFCNDKYDSNLKKFLYGSDLSYSKQEPASWVLCENSTGYIQSNAGRIDNTGETNVDKFDFLRSFGSEIVFPKLLIRQKSDDCLNELSGNQRDVVSFRIGERGELEKCSLTDVKNGRTATWNGIDVKCGLYKDDIDQRQGGDIPFYNTAWMADSQCTDRKYEITENYGRIGDFGSLEGFTLNPDTNAINYKEENSVEIIQLAGGEDDGTGVIYNLNNYNADSMEIKWSDLSSHSNIKIFVEDNSNNEYLIKRSDTLTNDNINEGTKWVIKKNGERIGGSELIGQTDAFEVKTGDAHESQQEKISISENGEISFDEASTSINGNLNGFNGFSSLKFKLHGSSNLGNGGHVTIDSVNLEGEIC